MQTKSKYGVGDVVIVKSWDEMQSEFLTDYALRISNPEDKVCFVYGMRDMCGREATITATEEELGGTSYSLDIDEDAGWIFRDWMLKTSDVSAPDELLTDDFINLVMNA